MAGMKSGAVAAQKAGVKTAPMQMTGPKGGKFYFNASGAKVYGVPKVGEHTPAGRKVEIDVGHEHLPATVVKSGKGGVTVRFHDGEVATGPHEAVRIHKEEAIERGHRIMKEAPPDPGWRSRMAEHKETHSTHWGGKSERDEFTQTPRPGAKLTQQEYQAIKDFTGSAYTAVRKYERGEYPGAPPHVVAQAKHINTAIEKHSVDFDGVLHRGIDNLSKETCAKILGQPVVQFDSMNSTSRRVSVADGFSYSSKFADAGYAIRFEIHKANGLVVEHVSGIKSEHEVILGAGTNYVVKRVWVDPGTGGKKFVVEVEGVNQ
jgi:hypothetical protein